MSSSPSSPRRLVICNINPLTCFPPIEKCYLDDHLASFLPPFRGETHPSTCALDQTLSCLAWDLIPLLVSSTSLSPDFSVVLPLSLFLIHGNHIHLHIYNFKNLYPWPKFKTPFTTPVKHHHMEASRHLKPTPGANVTLLLPF